MDILKIKEPILLDDVLSNIDNLNILEFLFANKSFQIGVNNPEPGKRLNKALLDEVQHAGFLCETACNFQENLFDDPLNIYAFVIVNQISKRLKFKYKNIFRVGYNYYCRNQCATDHRDSKCNNFISIVYNFHTTDGGTIILGKKYDDVVSQAKIFKSEWLHSSYSTVKDKGRVSLNIVIEI
jgi:hypothetical protein